MASSPTRHRQALISGTPKDWDGFFAAATAAATLPEGVALVLALGQQHDVVWLTGRPERTRGLTVEWLAVRADGQPGWQATWLPHSPITSWNARSAG